MSAEVLAAFSDPPIRTTREVELEEEVAALRDEIDRLGRELASARARVLEESEPEVVRLAIVVAEKVVGRELATDPALLASWIHEGLAELARGEDVTVAVAPDVAQRLSQDDAPETTVDPSLRAGSCELRQGATTVHVGAEARVAAIVDALGVPGAGDER